MRRWRVFAVGQFRDYVSLNNNLPDEILASIDQINQLSVLVDFIAAHIVQVVERKQPILSALSLEERFRLLNELLNSEIEILKLEQNIESQVRDKITRTQRTFYLQEQMRIIRKELGEESEDEEGIVSAYHERVEQAKLPEHARERVEEELNRLRMMSSMSPEANVIRNYLDWILAVPWVKRTRDNLNIDRAEEILHEDHYGLLKPKERILEHLAVLKRVKKIRGQIICFVGPPGVGKTRPGAIDSACAEAQFRPHFAGRRTRRGGDSRTSSYLHRRDARAHHSEHEARGKPQPCHPAGRDRQDGHGFSRRSLCGPAGGA